MKKNIARKLIVVSLLPAIATGLIAYKNFFFYRRGWHTVAIQCELIFWVARLLLAPLLVLFILKFRKSFDHILAFLVTQITSLVMYVAAHWLISFVLCRLFLANFDGRNRNLINTIRSGSLVMNLFVFVISLLILYTWTYFEQKKIISKEITSLEKSLAATNLKLIQAQEKGQQTILAKPDSLSIKNGHRTIMVPFAKIFCILSDGAYVKIITGDGTHLLNSRLYEIQKKLPGIFLRVHRSHIINTEFFKEIRSLLNGDHLILLANGMEVRASRTYRESLKILLS